MKRILFTTAMICLGAGAFAQTATTSSEAKTNDQVTVTATSSSETEKGKACCAKDGAKSSCAGAEKGKNEKSEGRKNRQRDQGMKSEDKAE